jgi:hypothetical protein
MYQFLQAMLHANSIAAPLAMAVGPPVALHDLHV